MPSSNVPFSSTCLDQVIQDANGRTRGGHLDRPPSDGESKFYAVLRDCPALISGLQTPPSSGDHCRVEYFEMNGKAGNDLKFPTNG